MLLERTSVLRAVEEAGTAAGGSMLLVTGPMGIGRTTLLDELARRATDRNVQVLRAVGDPSEQLFVLGIVTQLFDSMVRQAPADVRRGWFAGAAADTQWLFSGGSPVGSTGLRPHFLEGLRALVAAVCRPRPLLLLVDDLQHADDASLAFLSYLARRLNGLPVTVVVTLPSGCATYSRTRLRETIDAAERRFELSPLSQSGVAAVVRYVFDTDGDPEFVRACHTVSGGIPLLLLPPLSELADEGRTPSAEEAPSFAGLRPEPLRERLAQLVLWLPEKLRRCAAAMALLDRSARAGLIAQLAGLDSGDGATVLTVMEQLGLVETESTGVKPDGTTYPMTKRTRFRHPMFREAFIDALSDERYEELHLLAARLLLTHGHGAEEAAEHLLLTAAPLSRSLRTALRTAAETALDRGASQTSARYLRRALTDIEETSGTAVERSELLSDLAAAESRFAPYAADRHLRQALALAETPYEQSEVLVRFAPYWYVDATTVVELMQRFTEDTRRAPGTRSSRPPVWLEARHRSLGWGGEHAAESLERLTGLGPQVPVDTWADRQLAAVLLRSVTAAGLVPRADAVTLAHRILTSEMLSSPVHASLPLLTSTLFMADEVDFLQTGLGTALKRMDPDHDIIARSIALGLHAWTSVAQGNLIAARTSAEESLATADRLHPTAEPAFAALMMVALESRDLSLARQLREEIRLQASQIREYRLSPGGFPVLADMFRGMAADLAGNHSTALAVLLRCGRRVELVDGPVAGLQIAWRPWAARQYVQLHDTAAALELVDEDARIAEAWGAPKFIGRTLRMRATLVCGREAVKLAEASVEALEDSNNQLELARSLVTLGQLLRETGRLPQAEAQLRRGHDLAVQCGAHWVVSRAAGELKFLSRGGSRQPLTGAQRTVASWAAQGLTNRVIAQTLGITSRAVEKHLTAVYRKLGVTARADLRSVLSPDEMAEPPAAPASPPEPGRSEA